VWVATTNRADWSLLRPLLRQLADEPDLDRGLIIAGSHTWQSDTQTEAKAAHAYRLQALIDEAAALNWPVACLGPAAPDLTSAQPPLADAERVNSELSALLPTLAQSFARAKPDAVILLGDRYEVLAIGLAASLADIALVHIHGGEETEGALDNSFRHAITKLSHLHFCATNLARQRLLAMGEAPERVILTGAPGLDDLVTRADGQQALQDRLARPVPQGFVLVTLHAETLAPDHGVSTAYALTEALSRFGAPMVITAANNDPGGAAINAHLQSFCGQHPEKHHFINTLGVAAYPQALRLARLIVGNSSSGVLEAASFGVPVVNIGDRQKGRERAANVLDCTGCTEAILAALHTADSADFRAGARAVTNPYGDGQASPRMRSALLAFLAEGAPRVKRFQLQEASQ